MFSAAMVAAARGQKRAKPAKRPCPAERLVDDGEQLVCSKRGKPRTVKLGSMTATLDRRGVVRTPKALAGLKASDLATVLGEMRAAGEPASKIISWLRQDKIERQERAARSYGGDDQGDGGEAPF